MLWDDFINSEWRDWRKGERSEDKLEVTEWLRSFISEHRLNVPSLPTEEELKRLKELRALLLQYVQRIVDGRSLSRQEITQLNDWMRQGPLTPYLDTDADKQFSLSYSPLITGWEGAAANIAASFAEALTEGDPARFRICSNPNCRWVYYDTTRNRSKRYCDDKTCGNLMKVRRFRAKQVSSGERRNQPKKS